jgi:outer membrane lipoprotein-sorting protein
MRVSEQISKRLLLTIAACLFAFYGPALSRAQDVETVVRRVDELYRANSSHAEVEMGIVTPHWQRTLRMNIWTEGKSKTFIRILSPPKEEGVATLRLGTEMWNYLPRANKVIKIPPSMMMSSWMGSDFTNDDLVKEFTLIDDYHYRFINPEDAKPGLLYIELTPREGLPVVWGKIVAAVTKEDYLPVWDRYYDDKNRLMRIVDFKDVMRLGGRLIPSVMEVIPQDKEGQKTVLRYLSAEFDVSNLNDVFSLRNLHSHK